MKNIYLALVHNPVLNKKGKIVSSAVTNLDLHDLARLSKTYDLKAFFVITNISEQKDLVKKIQDHWLLGFGKQYNSNRSEALSLIRLASSIEDMLIEINNLEEKKPITIATSAKLYDKSISFQDIKFKEDFPLVLLFGTAWGLSQDIINNADFVLEPIKVNLNYNHLSVRTAAAIILDRLEKIL